MIKEKDELYNKTAKCLDFILSKKFDELNELQKELLTKQYSHMCSYLIILNGRINNEIKLQNIKEDD